MQTDNDTWFNQFTVMFEIVSAYGTIGISLGIPTVRIPNMGVDIL